MYRHLPASISAIALSVLILASSAAHGAAVDEFDAAAARHFFNEHGCNACHALDEQRIGPSYRAVSARYRSSVGSEVEDVLVHKVLHGGAGAWGYVPMVSNPRVPPAAARAAVRWILTLDPTP